jgi:hypothetical protein
LADEGDREKQTSGGSSQPSAPSESPESDTVKPIPPDEANAPIPDKPEGESGSQPPVTEGEIHSREEVLEDRIRKSDRWMISLTALAACAAIASAIIFGWQLSIMQGQLSEMRRQGELTEAMIDHPVWAMGIRLSSFHNPAYKGFATGEIRVKNVGKQFGNVELMLADVVLQSSYQPPEVTFPTSPKNIRCFALPIGEQTILPGDEWQFNLFCMPKFEFAKAKAVAEGALKMFLRIMVIYYDARGTAHEKYMLFLFRPRVEKALATYAAMGSVTWDIPETDTYQIRDMQRALYTHLLKVEHDAGGQFQEVAHLIPPPKLPLPAASH